MENIERYEAGVQPARDRFGSAPAMTEPVEGWIRRAGARCVQVGRVALGMALRRHAEAAAGQRLLMSGDPRSLCGRWNASRRPPLDPDELLTLPRPEAVSPLGSAEALALGAYRGFLEDCVARAGAALVAVG